MTESQWIDIAKQGGVLTLLAVLLGLGFGKLIRMIVMRHLKGFDKLEAQQQRSDDRADLRHNMLIAAIARSDDRADLRSRILGDRIEANTHGIRERLHGMAGTIQEHSEADAEVVNAIGRFESKLDTLLEITPRPQQPPQRASSSRLGDDEDTPPIGRYPPARPTPRPGSVGPSGYRPPAKPPRDDSEG